MKKAFTLGVAVLALTAVSAGAAELKFKPGEDSKFNWASYEELKKTQLKGEQITIFGPWLGPDQQLVESVLAYFAEATSADVRYTGSDSFEQQIVVDLEAGSAPNIAIFPQPGLASDMAKRGFLTDLGDDNATWLKDNYAAGQSWVDLGTYAGKDSAKHFYGFPFKTDLKSLVWYSPENFQDAGYEVPKTMEELKALTEKIVADGGTPWCIGLGSGAATGWPATDWVEDLMLRTTSPENYDKWVSNEMKFSDPIVINAINEFGWFAKNDKFVAGGTAAVASTDFRDSPKGLFSSPPQCYMHRQASFIPSFFPEGTVVGQDVDFFYFPAYADKNLGNPVLGAGTTFTITKDSKAARAFIEFLKSPIAHEIWMAQKGFLTPYKKVNTEVFTDPTVRKMNDILLQATTFRFDASDLMPGAVGAGSFWTGMVDYVGGKSADDVAASIQKSWDAIK
ncbi:maltose-binding protein /trehalose-binding protein /sucrose-binding protein [Ciceribacter lividus]|uniref:Maltose-binding protein /trehalose-binding protein /sucrose-binding protein n=1 Tax=Ciceribacter lividus TaxID=1197950 RepID=A0A6I7HNL2_9HYPH|nr:ABC transporter substrate-binding protein [Ciceribacter lividus]RCW27289.1 maltose-binding protein /trehalose-binding protein /sucrose-binding protein [Ciceribacter lividus]